MPVFLADLVAKGFWWAILASIMFVVPFGIVGGILSAKVNKFLGSILQYVPSTFFTFYIWRIRGGAFWLICVILALFGLILTIVGAILKKKLVRVNQILRTEGN